MSISKEELEKAFEGINWERAEREINKSPFIEGLIVWDRDRFDECVDFKFQRLYSLIQKNKKPLRICYMDELCYIDDYYKIEYFSNETMLNTLFNYFLELKDFEKCSVLSKLM